MKKILLTLLILVIFIGIGVFVYFKFFNEKEEELTYLNETLEPSTQSNYLNNSIGDVLKYLDRNNIKKEIGLKDLKIENEKCSGKISPVNNTYVVSAECLENSPGYNINYILTPGIELETLQNISEVIGGYIFVGTVSGTNGIIGFLDRSGNIKWQTPITFKNKDHVAYKTIETNNSYVIFDQSIDQNKGASYFIKLDKNGKVLLHEKISDYPMNFPPKYNGNNSFIVTSGRLDDKMEHIVISENGEILNTFKTNVVKNIEYQDNSIYYIEGKDLVITDNKGSKQKSFTIKNIGDIVSSLVVINNKILIADQENIFIYDLDGILQKEYNYSSLAISKDKFSGTREKPIMFSNIKVNGNAYYNWFINGYTMVDRYDQNLELIYRKLFKNPIEDIGSANYDTTIMMGEEVSNIKYSTTYKMFVKTVYNE